jgi:hypothetical protein
VFFAELVSTQGRLLKIEDCSANKERLDFARLLIATNAIQKVDVTIKVLIDNSVSCIRLIEDVGFGFAKNACLVECGEDVDNVSQFSVHTGMQDDDPLIEEFVQDFHEDWNNKRGEASKANSDTVNQGEAPDVRTVANVVSKHLSPLQPFVLEPVEEAPSPVPTTSCCKLKKKIRVPPAYGIRKMARLSAVERNSLILSMKKAKRKQRGASCPTKTGSHGTNCTSFSGIPSNSNKTVDSK